MVYNGSVSPLLLPPVGLIQEFHTLAVKTAPVVAVKERMQGLAEDPRRLLEKLLKLFAQVHCVQYSLLQCIANYPSTIDSFIPWKYCRSNGCRWSAIVAHFEFTITCMCDYSMGQLHMSHAFSYSEWVLLFQFCNEMSDCNVRLELGIVIDCTATIIPL